MTAEINLFCLFVFPKGYERVLCNSQRPSAVGLQASGWKRLQHAPHCVKGKTYVYMHLLPSWCWLILRFWRIWSHDITLSGGVSKSDNAFCISGLKSSATNEKHGSKMLVYFWMKVRPQELHCLTLSIISALFMTHKHTKMTNTVHYMIYLIFFFLTCVMSMALVEVILVICDHC